MPFSTHKQKFHALLGFHKIKLIWVYGVYVLLSLLLQVFHEPWRDEMQAFLLARNSFSIQDLYQHTRYEGHPMCWFLLLYFLKLFSQSFVLVKIVHWLIINLAMILLMFHSKIQKSWKILIPFGYFFLYEYQVICRNYSIGILCLFAALFFAERKKWFWVVILLIGCFESNVYMLLVACACWIFFFFQEVKNSPKIFVTYSCILILAAFATLYLTLPPPDVGFANSSIKIDFALIRSLIDAFSKAFILLPELKIQFWNTHCLETNATTFMGCSLLVFFLGYFSNYKTTLLFFVIGSCLVACFMGLKYLGFWRHQGHFYLIFIVSLWLNAIYYKEKKIKFQFAFECLITAIFLLQIYTTAVASYYEISYPFSQGKSVADYIQNERFKKHFLIASQDFTASTVAGFLNQPIYYLNRNVLGTYVIWDTKRVDEIADSFIQHSLDSFAEQNDVLFIHYKPLQNNNTSLKLLATFNPDICGRESYYLYEKKKSFP